MKRRIFHTRFSDCRAVCCALLVSVAVSPNIFAQLSPIGQWRIHIPYNNPLAVHDGGDELFVGNSLSVYRYQKEDGSINRLSKINLLSDIGVRDLHYRETLDALIIAYSNSNIDVLKGDRIFNFPFIRNQNIVGDKNIYGVGYRGDSAYLGCGFGIVVLDLVREQSPATYFFFDEDGLPIRVNDVVYADPWVMAATPDGLYRAEGSDALLEDFSRWEEPDPGSGLPVEEVNDLFLFRDTAYARIEGIIYQFDGSGWLPWYDAGDYAIRSVHVRNDYLILNEYQGVDGVPDSVRIRVYEGSVLAESLDGSQLSQPMAIDRDANGDLWIADIIRGLTQVRTGQVLTYINPDGPQTPRSFDMSSGNGQLFVAPGGVNNSFNKLFNRDGFFRFDGNSWFTYNAFNIAALDSVTDIISTVFDPGTGTAWLGAHGDGLLEFTADGNLTIYKQGTGLQPATGDFTNYRVSGLGLNPQTGDLWIANNGAPRPIVVRRADNTWYNFPSGLPAIAGDALTQCLVDDFGQVWYRVFRGNGILVYDPGNDVTSSADDRKKNLGLGAGNGNLPSAEVLCLAKDLDGEIWVGTEEGIAVFYNPGSVLEPGTIGDAAQIIVELDGFPAILLEDEFVRVIAIDGGNRKWIGTDNGVFLLSEDGQEQLAHFTTLNSPLLDDNIRTIGINGSSGEVFIGTEKGIISYRGEATSGGLVHENVQVFPNPVREDYDGPIAISGLVQDAEVRITDVSGRLVYQTIALGGQAIWDGRRVDNGARASSGVYLVFSLDANGVEKYATKFLMLRGTP